MRAHEDYLETEAKKIADKARYTDPGRQATQIIEARNEARKRSRESNADRVHIVVDRQHYTELYYSKQTTCLGEHLTCSREDPSEPFPDGGIHLTTLMGCSSTAYDFFTLKPNETVLHLPVCYPRQHAFGQGFKTDRDYVEFVINNGPENIEETGLAYLRHKEDQMAFIRDEEITLYLIPWLSEMEKYLKNEHRASGEEQSDLPRITIPEDLLQKIHLYNVMLQLGISMRFKQPLIDSLILQMYETRLQKCHLDTLEMTVARFYSHGVPILDPVLNHLVGTYALRTRDDREHPALDEKQRVLQKLPEEDEAREREKGQLYLEAKPERGWLEYQTQLSDERRFIKRRRVDDTVIQPPKLEVIGHCIRHWSGIRRSGNTAAAHTGYPLNVGRVLKYYRRRATSPIRINDKADYPTYRLHCMRDNHGNRIDPGLPGTGTVQGPVPTGGAGTIPAQAAAPIGVAATGGKNAEEVEA